MLSFDQTLEREWLQARFHILELAAILDRVDGRAPDDPQKLGEAPRLLEMRQALSILTAPAPALDRAERILLLYSDPATGPR
jgi:hypothetical protein